MRLTGNNIRSIRHDLAVNYSDHGPDDVPSIIFIHGFPLNKSMWDMQVEALKDTYRVIAYDVRGHGYSDSGNTKFSIALFASDLLDLMDAIGLERTIVCGLSMGGYIALNAVINNPDRFDALILSDTQCIADSKIVKTKRWEAIQSIKENGVENYANESLINLFATESFFTRQKEIAAVKDMILSSSQESLANTLSALMTRKETCSKLSKITIPVLFIVGDQDNITPVTSSELMHNKIPSSYLKIISHAGHLSNIENPSVFNYHIERFLHRFAWKQSHYREEMLS